MFEIEKYDLEFKEKISESFLKTVNAFSNYNDGKIIFGINDEGYYNIAGELLADENDIEYSGIDIVKFGKDINQILYRETLSNKSVLWQYDKTIKIFERYYQYEEIEGYERVRKELIPRESFRESLANAIVYRVWDVKTHIQIAMYTDRIEISSPGGLPLGISEEEFVIYNILKDEVEITRRELDEKSGFNKSKTLRIINGLIDKNLIRKLGSGPSTTYILN